MPTTTRDRKSFRTPEQNKPRTVRVVWTGSECHHVRPIAEHELQRGQGQRPGCRVPTDRGGLHQPERHKTWYLQAEEPVLGAHQDSGIMPFSPLLIVLNV